MNDQAPLRDDTKSAADARPVKLLCKDIWKVFGPGAEKFSLIAAGWLTQKISAKPNSSAPYGTASLEVRRGENFIVLGLSGSGKSTLVRCLSRANRADVGHDRTRRHQLAQGDARRADRNPPAQNGHGVQHFALLAAFDGAREHRFSALVQGVDRKSREARARKVIDLVRPERP